MQSPCLRHNYLCSYLFAIPPTCFPLIVVPFWPPPPLPMQDSHSLSGWGSGVAPGCLSHPPPPPPGDAARVFVPSYPTPPGMPPGCFSHHTLPPPGSVSSFPVIATPIAPFDAPLPPVDAVTCAVAPPPPPQPWHTPCFQSLVVGGTSPPHPLPTTTSLWRPTIGGPSHPPDSKLTEPFGALTERSVSAHCAVSRAQ